jgi:hypothetical protein
MNINLHNYKIVWAVLPNKGLRTSTRRALPQLAPYLVEAAGDPREEPQSEMALNNDTLFRGVLHEWLTPRHPRTSSDPARWHLALRYLLEDLRGHSGFASLELMALVHATQVREQSGHLPALKMLMTAHQLLKRSTEIRSDLVLDLWALVENVEDLDRESAFVLIRQLYDGIRFEALREDVTDQLDYANFVALSYLGDYQRRNWLFWRTISKRVRHKHLKYRMIHLLNLKSTELHGGTAVFASAQASKLFRAHEPTAQ